MGDDAEPDTGLGRPLVAMTGRVFPHVLAARRPVQLGLIVLQADETLEGEFRCLLSPKVELLVSRVPSGTDVTPASLAAMEGHLTQAAAVLPKGARFAALGYACTSGAAQIGADRVAARIAAAIGTDCPPVTDPVTALKAACGELGVRRLALLSPYTARVSDRLREVLSACGIDTPAFGSFDVAEEARVARIDGTSIRKAALALAADGGCDALFLSCTNLRTLSLIAGLEAETGLPVLSSNLGLAWHLSALAGAPLARGVPGRLAGSELTPAPARPTDAP